MQHIVVATSNPQPLQNEDGKKVPEGHVHEVGTAVWVVLCSAIISDVPYLQTRLLQSYQILCSKVENFQINVYFRWGRINMRGYLHKSLQDSRRSHQISLEFYLKNFLFLPDFVATVQKFAGGRI
jgi:hypothetical protein